MNLKVIKKKPQLQDFVEIVNIITSEVSSKLKRNKYLY